MEKLHVRDHSVSGEKFYLVKNSKYGYLETKPQPNLEKLNDYYNSEDYISHTNSKRNIFEKIYQIIRRYTINRKIKLINSIKTENKILLDIGCGTGDFLFKAKQKGWTITGIEPNEKARNIANKVTKNLVFDTNSLNKLKENKYDVITLWHVLEHLPNLDDQINKLKKLLKKKGTLIIAVPNYKSHDAQIYKSNWAAYDVPRHLWHFSKSSIKKLFEEKNMKVVKILPMYLDAYYVCMLSEKYQLGKTNLVKSIKNAWCSNLKAKKTKEYSSLIYIIKNV